MKTNIQRPNDHTIPQGVPGTLLKSQVKPETFTIEDVLSIANSRFDTEARRRIRHALGLPIPEQTPEDAARRQQSMQMRQKYLDDLAKDAARKRNKRHRDAVKEGRQVRSYKKRKR